MTTIDASPYNEIPIPATRLNRAANLNSYAF